MQAILACSQANATVQTSYFASISPCVFSSGLGTVAVGASLSAVQALLQGLPTGGPARELLRHHGRAPERLGNIAERHWRSADWAGLFRHQLVGTIVQ